MPQQFVVPQFIDVEDKIIGPITVRQFVILLVTALILAIVYKLATLTAFIITTVLVGGFGATLAFVKINGQPFHFFMLNLFQTFRLPQLRIWNKQLTVREILELTKVPPPPPKVVTPKKEPLATTKLAELTMVVNTGGVYRPEEW